MIAENIKTEVLIIGAGPAGASVSLFLAKMNIGHLIVDAAVFPRDKICGDGLDLKVVRVLRHLDREILGGELIDNQIFMSSWGTRFITQNGREMIFARPPEPGASLPYPLFYTAKRLHFDHFLVKKIDRKVADFRQGLRITHMVREKNGWRVQGQVAGDCPQEIEIHAKLIVGADGDRSLLLKHLGERKIDRRHYAGSLRQYWRGVTGMHPQNLIEVYFPPSLPMSYFYLFPLPGGETNVGYGMVSQVIARGGYHLRRVFSRLIREDPVLSPRFQYATALEEPAGWGIPLASKKRKPYGDGYLLVGDAASLVCPTSGEGIGTGMVSGYIAAHFIAKSLKINNFTSNTFRHYEREIYRRLRHEILLYRMMMSVSPKIYDRLLNILAPHPLFQWSFRRQAPRWLQTAYEKEIEVRCD